MQLKNINHKKNLTKLWMVLYRLFIIRAKQKNEYIEYKVRVLHPIWFIIFILAYLYLCWIEWIFNKEIYEEIYRDFCFI